MPFMKKPQEPFSTRSQDGIVEHQGEDIEELLDDALWDEAFSRTRDKLILEAKRVRREIAAGQARPLVRKDCIMRGRFERRQR
jgi:hypothetical protein